MSKHSQAEISHKVGGHWGGREYQGGRFQNVSALRVPPEHTDHSWFIRYEGPGWESDKVGYRFYLDWRNATDIFGKKTPKMVLQDAGQDGFDSYHKPAEWGMDILKVGKSLGIGSPGLWAGDRALRVEDTDSIECSIPLNGPVQSMVKTHYYGWKAGPQAVGLTSEISIHAGSRLSRSSLKLSAPLPNLCTGIVKHENAPLLKIEEAISAMTINISQELPWSERMAMSVMKRSPEAWMNDFSEEPRWSCTHGLVMLSMLKAWEASQRDIYFEYARPYVDTMILEDGTIRDYEIDEFNIDHINPGKFLFTLYEKTGKENYGKAITTLKRQLDWQPRNKDGGFWHKLRYPWQMWLDGLYMGAPFYAEYAMRNKQTEAFEDIAQQFILMEEHARDPETGLLYHGWDQSRVQRWADPETGLSPHFWGRAVGGYTMALVDVLDFFPENHPKRAELVAMLTRTLDAVIKVRDTETAVWYQVLDQGTKAGNYLEATASCMFTYAMIKGVNEGYLEERFRPIAQESYAGIQKQFIRVDENGEVHLENCCAVAGLGGNPYRDGSYEYYISEPVRDNDPKGVGPFILDSLEFEKGRKVEQ